MKSSRSTLTIALLAALALSSACTSGTSGKPHSSSAIPTTPSSQVSTPTQGDTTPVITDTPTPSDSASSSAPAKTVTVIITNSSWDAIAKVANANAIVPGTLVPEGTGVCTLTLALNGISRSIQRTAVSGGTSMQCGVMTIPGSMLTPGSWSATVRFTSPTATGISDTSQITVSG